MRHIAIQKFPSVSYCSQALTSKTKSSVVLPLALGVLVAGAWTAGWGAVAMVASCGVGGTLAAIEHLEIYCYYISTKEGIDVSCGKQDFAKKGEC